MEYAKLISMLEARNLNFVRLGLPLSQTDPWSCVEWLQRLYVIAAELARDPNDLGGVIDIQNLVDGVACVEGETLEYH